MKKAIALVIVVIIFLLARTVDQKKGAESEVIKTDTTKEEVKNVSDSKAETEENGELEISWVKITDPEKIDLMSNLEKKEVSSQLITNLVCKNVVSGSFYTKEDTHIGLFIANEKKISDSTDNNFYNGYFTIYKDGSSGITSIAPKNPKHSVQSGPFLINKGVPRKLDFTNDEEARRIVVAKTRENEIIFMIYYNSKNTLLGPSLTKLPQLVKYISDKNNLNIQDALNLDGGSHSAFVTENIKVSEIQTSGSFYCIKP